MLLLFTPVDSHWRECVAAAKKLGKEREKVKRFCFISSKLVNELCYMLQSGHLDIFSSKRKKKEKRRKKKRTVERHLCLILPVGLILPVF